MPLTRAAPHPGGCGPHQTTFDLATATGRGYFMRTLVLTNLYPNPFQPTRATFNRQQLRALAARHPVEVISPIAWADELAARCHAFNDSGHVFCRQFAAIGREHALVRSTSRRLAQTT